uniref:Putative cytochrome P450 n=1 Tax=Fallopia multiflora TaxID=76025 RepID=A0A2D1PE09_9CARY|nr:putative cytochrome P450 [Fallopia multiflora]
MENLMLNMKSIVWAVLVWTLLQWLVSEKLLRVRRRLPPGPTSLPVIGNLHNLTKKPHKALAELAKIHGPLMYLRFGLMDTVVVSSSEVARQVLQKKDAQLSNRTVPDCFRALNFDEYSMAMMPPVHRWRIVRKIANTLLFSSKTLDANQEIRMKKIKDLISYVGNCSQARVAVNVGQVAFDTSLSLLSNTFFSMNLADPGSELSREFKQLTWDISRDAAKPNLADLFPVFKSVDPQGIKRRMASHFKKLLDVFDVIIDKRLASHKDGALESCNDVLDALLKICQDNSEDFELRQVRHMLIDLFFAGSETTSSTLEWAMAELLHEPTKLKATQEELGRVVGRGNFVEEADFARLPYLRAVLSETFRLHPPLPFLLPRKASSDTEVHGFKIPKDSQVFVNTWAIGRDPDVWKNPNEFEPERFLNSEIDFKGNHFELLPFGSGRRICVGLPLAIRMLPLMLGNLLNFFEWKLEDGVKPEAMDMDDKFGMALQKATPVYAIPVDITI